MPKIGLDQIIDSENIRRDYADIEELADSILKRGQLEPVLVKKAKAAEDGTPAYELIAGFRRFRAIKSLQDKGQAISQIDAVVVTGDRLTIQLVENLQRSDLSAREREEGIFQMVQSGMTQKEVAAELSKKEDYISRHVSAYKIRKIAEESGLDTSIVETFTLSEIQTVKEKDIPMILGFIINAGGTKTAARQIMKDYRGDKKPAPQTPEGEAKKGNFEKADGESPMNESASFENPLPGSDGGGDNIDPLAGSDIEPVQERPRHSEPINRDEILTDHRVIDVQTVFDKIYEYLSALEKKIREAGPEAEEAIIAEYKKDATYDIIAIIHEGL
jgi:ParB/RepB/Spo0J family partition protein